ncbi:MAG TPA: hypothetical protein V6C58_14675, partial [Allocoleopsis sp.]
LRFFAPVLLVALIFGNYSCSKVGVLSFTPTDVTIALDVNASTGDTFVKDTTVNNSIKKEIENKNISTSNIKAILLKKIVATIPSNANLNYEDIDSATFSIDGVEVAKLPTSKTGKTVSLTIMKEDVTTYLLEKSQLTFKYNAKTNKATPAAKITLTLTHDVQYQVL